MKLLGGGQYLAETVIFGGVLVLHFGHAVLECLSRLWHVIESGASERIAFLLSESSDLLAVKLLYKDFFELLGIDLKRVIYIEKPAQFDRVIVPDETVLAWSSGAQYKEKYTAVYEKMMSAVEAKDAKKIYLTRAQLKNPDCLNEEYFEEFYKRRGFAVIAPEKLKLSEQVAYMKGADEVVCTLGTLSHLILFSKPGARLTCLLRSSENPPLTPQMVANQAKKIDFYAVDATFNFLPVSHGLHSFLLGPNKRWKDYLEATGEKYAENELDMDMGRWAYEYLLKWCALATSPGGWNTLTSFDNFDFVNSLSAALLDAPLKRENYPGSFKEKEAALLADMERLKAAIADPTAARFEAEIERLQAENKALKGKVWRLEGGLNAIKNSSSWKVTYPFRKASSLLCKWRERAKGRAMLKRQRRD